MVLSFHQLKCLFIKLQGKKSIQGTHWKIVFKCFQETGIGRDCKYGPHINQNAQCPESFVEIKSQYCLLFSHTLFFIWGYYNNESALIIFNGNGYNWSTFPKAFIYDAKEPSSYRCDHVDTEENRDHLTRSILVSFLGL